MDKIKALLLPLAFAFAAIAVFEVGVRYGAVNMRAYAIAGELEIPVSIYSQFQSSMKADARETLELIIDDGIGVGALLRKTWYLNKNARSALDKALAHALTVRGDAAGARLGATGGGEGRGQLSKARLAEIQTAIREAKVELVDNAPGVAETEAAGQTEE